MVDLDGLSVTVSAQTAKFTAGMSRVKDGASEAALSLRRLGAASDSAERDLDSAGRSATTTALQFNGLTAATNGSNTAFMGLSATTIGALVPALGTLLAAVTPVVAALGGFVAIAGAITGIGIIGIMGAIATRSNLMEGAFENLIETVKTEFGPVFSVAAHVIATLLNELENIIPALVPTDETVSRLAGNFAHLGTVLINALPAFMDLATTLATEFLPPFVTFVEDVLPGAPGFIESLVTAFRRVMPMFRDFGAFLQRFLPELLDFGYTALPVVADALGLLGGVMMDVLQFVNGLASGMDQLIAEASLIAPVLIPLVSFLGGPVTLVLAAAAGAVAGLALAFKNNFANIQDYLGGLWSEFQSVLPAIRGAMEAFLSGVDFAEIKDAVSDFEDVLGNQLMQTLTELKPVFDDFQEFLKDNREEFALMGEAAGEFLTTLINISTSILRVLYPAIRSVLIPALETIIKVADLGVSAIGDMIRAFQAVRSGNFEQALGVVEQSETPAALADLVTPGQDITQQGLENRIQNQIEVIVEGELPEESIREVSVNSEQRSTRRNQGRALNPN